MLSAYENPAQGERLALCQMQALDAQREQVQAQGTLRSAAPGAVLTLTDHPTHDGLDAQRDRFVILSARHQARSNLRADLKTQVHSLLGAVVAEHLGGQGGHGAQAGHGGQASQGGQDLPNTPPLQNASDTPVYQTHLRLQRHAVPVRVAGIDEAGRPDVRLSPRPSANGMNGAQTAIVVGSGPIHTDRDHRIKIQFHWQRGANASHRLSHTSGNTSGNNAPASEQSGTWVRVAQSVAGANWGANFIPRVGQEVLVGFVGGDIDRPVVLGSVYNGQGQPDAQANQAAGGAAGSTGNAPAWFPGSQAQGALQAHQHPAVLAGHKSQELASSQGGSGGHNQLVFDDSPGAGRIELATTSAQTRLQLGHLLHQTDNRRLQPRGHGLDLLPLNSKTRRAWLWGDPLRLRRVDFYGVVTVGKACGGDMKPWPTTSTRPSPWHLLTAFGRQPCVRHRGLGASSPNAVTGPSWAISSICSFIHWFFFFHG